MQSFLTFLTFSRCATAQSAARGPAPCASSRSALAYCRWCLLRWREGLPTAKAGGRGHASSERLGRVGAWMRGEVAQKRVPGATVIVVRGGKLVYSERLARGPDSAAPLRSDDIFRIVFLMTKPIVSVAAMMLVEEGRCFGAGGALYPVVRQRQGGRGKDRRAGQQVTRTGRTSAPMTVQDLLRHTSGLTYGFFGDSLVRLPISTPTSARWQHHQCRIRRAHLSDATGVSARQYVGLQQFDRRTWSRDRGRQRPESARSPERAPADAAGMKDTSFRPEPERQARIADRSRMTDAPLASTPRCSIHVLHRAWVRRRRSQ